MSCPVGSGSASTTTLGREGGTAALSGTRSTRGVPFSLEIFAGSLDTNVKVKLSELAIPTPEGYEDWSPIYAIEPTSLELKNGGALALPWEVPHPGGGSVPRTVGIFTAESLDGPWERLPDSYLNAGFSQATVLTGGYFFVGLPRTDDACE
jgi:hypothetical protein